MATVMLSSYNPCGLLNEGCAIPTVADSNIPAIKRKILVNIIILSFWFQVSGFKFQVSSAFDL
jgi:hypothetical protein